MKILHVSSSDLLGGAARAAYRLHQALSKLYGYESQMIVQRKASDDPTVIMQTGALDNYLRTWGPRLARKLLNGRFEGTSPLYSPGFIPTGIKAWIDHSDADIINLHWVANETISIEQIGAIRQPIVWTLHDMWPLAGAEHYLKDGPDAPFRLGYTFRNRGDRINNWVMQRKIRHWKGIHHLVASSQWLADCASESLVFKGHGEITQIPVGLDIQVFRPSDSTLARRALGLPADRKLVLFGASEGSAVKIKGFDLLVEALKRVGHQEIAKQAHCVIFGQSKPAQEPDLGLPVSWMGHLSDDHLLALLYSAADVMVVPSRQEAFGQTASEAMACGTPVVAFDTTGLRTVVENQRTGLLVPPFDTDALAHAIVTLVTQDAYRDKLGEAAEQRVRELFSVEMTARKYAELYERVIASGPSKGLEPQPESSSSRLL